MRDRVHDRDLLDQTGDKWNPHDCGTKCWTEYRAKRWAHEDGRPAAVGAASGRCVV